MKCNNCNHQHDSNTKWCTLIRCLCTPEQFEPVQELQPVSYYQKTLKQLTDVYDKIKYLHENIPEFRNNDHMHFLFNYWHYHDNYVVPPQVRDTLTNTETIRRTRQKLVEENPELGPTDDGLVQAKIVKEQAYHDYTISGTAAS